MTAAAVAEEMMLDFMAGLPDGDDGLMAAHAVEARRQHVLRQAEANEAAKAVKEEKWVLHRQVREAACPRWARRVNATKVLQVSPWAGWLHCVPGPFQWQRAHPTRCCRLAGVGGLFCTSAYLP